MSTDSRTPKMETPELALQRVAAEYADLQESLDTLKNVSGYSIDEIIHLFKEGYKMEKTALDRDTLMVLGHGRSHITKIVDIVNRYPMTLYDVYRITDIAKKAMSVVGLNKYLAALQGLEKILLW